MEGVSRTAEALLRTDISLATSIDRLLASLRRVHTGAVPTRGQLLRELSRRPERFRVLTPGRGPWRGVDKGVPRRAEGFPEVAVAPVIVPLIADGSGPSGCDGGDLLRRSLYWLGALLDEDSPRDIARWVRLAHSCARTEARLRRIKLSEL